MPRSHIDVWWIPLSVHDCAAFPDSTLSPEERARAAAFRFEEHARRFRDSHAALRLILEQFGKPFITGSTPVHFNLSHADDVALVAVSCDVEVGVGHLTEV